MKLPPFFALFGMFLMLITVIARAIVKDCGLPAAAV